MKQERRLAGSFVQQNVSYSKEPFKKKSRREQTLADVMAKNKKIKAQAHEKL